MRVAVAPLRLCVAPCSQLLPVVAVSLLLPSCVATLDGGDGDSDEDAVA